ncbi:hypothetical protein NE865_14817 [Phthorimaea operculella]|nr:hypothetical protein NE865_14817 [Phthorimaea operculella]
MGDPHELPPQSPENQNVLPDVVHSQQIPVLGTAVAGVTETVEIDTGRTTASENQASQDVDDSETESISEHVPSKMEYSVTESDNVVKIDDSQALKTGGDAEKVSKHSSLNIPYTFSPFSDNPAHDETQHSSSWPLEGHPTSDVHPLSEESPVILASSELSKDASHDKSPDHTIQPSEEGSPQESLKEEEVSYLDSLNEEASRESNISVGQDESLKSSESEKVASDKSSGSEEIIKLDIRGKGVPKFPLSAAKIIFGPPPEGSNVIGPDIEPLPVFQNLLSPFLVSGGDLKVEEVFDYAEMPYKDPSLERSPEPSPTKEASPEQSAEVSMAQSFSSDKAQEDCLIEEVTVDNFNATKEKEDLIPEKDDASMTQPKSFPETISFSTLTTDYKTICEEYHAKLVHLEDAISQRDELIQELTVSLQRSVKDQDELRLENTHLSNEVQTLQHIVAEHSQSDHDTIKAQLSDFMKYESMVNDSTKFYSALMSGGSSIRSSNSEKDNVREEITVNYSRSDLKSSSQASDDFQTGFENKLSTIIDKYEDEIEENLRNKLRESIIQVLCTEIGKMRIESDTELRDIETQMQQEKQAYSIETRKLRELLASVKAGNADIDALREELSIKHEKEMENLRTYFEKKCSDMERSYSEEVWRGRACASPAGSASSLDVPDAAGDYARRRTRSAEFPSLTIEPTQQEQTIKQMTKKYEQQIEELKTEHAALVNNMQARHCDAIDALQQQQIEELKTEHAALVNNMQARHCDAIDALQQQPSQQEQTIKQISKKFEQQIEELKTEHAAIINNMAARHCDAIDALQQQITQLKAHIQTSENTESNMPLYQQDIDLELEKKVQSDLETKLEEVRNEVAQQLQEQIQVLLSDPDAEVSSWPVELVALRDKIHETRSLQEKEVSLMFDIEYDWGCKKERQVQTLKLYCSDDL